MKPAANLEAPQVVAPAQRPNKPNRRLAGWVLGSLLLIIGGGLFYSNFPAMRDFTYARIVYQPSEVTTKLASELELTGRGYDIFMASRPIISDSSDSFPCRSLEENSVILGCYESSLGVFDLGFIYLVDVDNPVLEGVVQVTAAHELLHAAYERLSVTERARVNAMLESEYKKIEHDPVIVEQMRYYEIAEPGQDLNELHSIIGTTVAMLDPDIEDYYSRYFKNRSSIVTSYQNYYQALHKNDKEIEHLSEQLEVDLGRIKADIGDYTKQLTAINEEIDGFNSRARTGRFAGTNEFNYERSQLMSRIHQLEIEQIAINDRVDRYNKSVERLNLLSTESQSLFSSLKGVAAPETATDG